MLRLLALVFCFTGSGAIRIVSHPTVYTSPGQETSLSCVADEGPIEFCVFVRPDGTELCPDGEPPFLSASCSLEEGSNTHVTVGNDNCLLEIGRVEAGLHLGTWQCRAYFWDENNKDTADVQVLQHKEAELEFEMYYGTVSFEAGHEQRLTCLLDPAYSVGESGGITWELRGGEGLGGGMSREIEGAEVSLKQGVLASSLLFTPLVTHHGSNLVCSNSHSGQEDHIELSVFMYDSSTEELRPAAVLEGEDAVVEHVFSAFPRPSSEAVIWLVDGGYGITTSLSPGEQQGQFAAGRLVDLGGNQYSAQLTVKAVSVDDSGSRHSLHLHIADSKNVTLPFSLQVESAPPPILPPQNPNNELGRPTVLVPPKPNYSEQEVAEEEPDTEVLGGTGMSIWIVVGVLVLLVLLCLLFYCVRFCNKSDYVPVEKDAEAAIIKPLPEGTNIRKEEEEKNEASEKLEALLEEEKKGQGPSKKEQEELEKLEKTLVSLETGEGVKMLVLPLPRSKDTVDSGHKAVSVQLSTYIEADHRASVLYSETGEKVATLPRNHPASQEEHAENRGHAEQLRMMLEKEKEAMEEGEKILGIKTDKKESVENKDEKDIGWAKPEVEEQARRTGEDEDEEERWAEERKRILEEEEEVRKLDVMIAARELEEKRRKEELDEQERKKREKEKQEREEEEKKKQEREKEDKEKEEREKEEKKKQDREKEEKENQERDKQEKEKKESERKNQEKVDEENNSLPVTPVRKVLSRTSSFEVIRSKTIILEDSKETMERTTMVINTSPKEPEPVELKISVRSPPARPGQLGGFLEGARPGQLGDFLEGGDRRPSPTARITREVRVLPVMTIPLPKRRPKESNSNSEENDKSNGQTEESNASNGHTAPSSPSSDEGRGSGREFFSSPPQSPPPVLQKPPLPQRSMPSTPTDPLLQDTPQGGLSRSNSIGTQTPRIKARTQVFFDEAASSSEESLSDALAKEELQREVEKLKRELEGRKDGEVGTLERKKEGEFGTRERKKDGEVGTLERKREGVVGTLERRKQGEGEVPTQVDSP